MISEDRGPRVGDVVSVEARGRVVGMVDRLGIPSALVELTAYNDQVCVPLDALVVLRRDTREPPRDEDPQT